MEEGVGAKLRDARSRRRIGLSEVEEAIKIRGRYLRAIENEEWEQLPGDTYARAFIRTYGAYLGLDGERLAEEHRRGSGATRPGERLPRVDPRPRRVSPRHRPGARRPRLPGGLVTAAVVAVVVVALIVIGLAGGGSGDSQKGGRAAKAPGRSGGKAGGTDSGRPRPSGHQLSLLARAEVWVCLLDGKDRPLVKGVILAPGEREGPFRSGSFTLALGNGAVTMTVDGRQQNLPEPSSPIGFTVGRHGVVSELPEGERPTCS